MEYVASTATRSDRVALVVDELAEACERFLSRRAYTFAELTAATGARRGRLSGVLVRFQRDGVDLVNEGGTDCAFQWKIKRARRAGR